MSLLPLEVINTYRSTINTVIDTYGVDCLLYIPKENVIEQRQGLDIYEERPRLNEEGAFQNPLKTKVFIEWKPDTKALRKLGVFVEDSLPIIAWFKGIEELTRNSYIRVPINVMPNEWQQDEFELVDCIRKNIYNAIVVQAWSIAPRRR
jgi:hypothetical protein